VVWKKFTDLKEVLAASIIGAMSGIVLIMEAASTSETTINFTRLHGATTQKTVIFIFAAV
jgi:hypothetical protein